MWWRTTGSGEEIDLVVTSPLTRCIQTTMMGFLPGTKYAEGRREPKMVCSELAREAYGVHYPDRRRDLSLLKMHWPMLNFEPMTEHDDLWTATGRETIAQLQERILKFLGILIQMAESNVVVVSHGVWIEACLNMLCPEALNHGSRRVYNCDVFCGDCISEDGKVVRLQNVQLIQ